MGPFLQIGLMPSSKDCPKNGKSGAVPCFSPFPLFSRDLLSRAGIPAPSFTSFASENPQKTDHAIFAQPKGDQELKGGRLPAKPASHRPSRTLKSKLVGTTYRRLRKPAFRARHSLKGFMRMDWPFRTRSSKAVFASRSIWVAIDSWFANCFGEPDHLRNSSKKRKKCRQFFPQFFILILRFFIGDHDRPVLMPGDNRLSPRHGFLRRFRGRSFQNKTRIETSHAVKRCFGKGTPDALQKHALSSQLRALCSPHTGSVLSVSSVISVLIPIHPKRQSVQNEPPREPPQRPNRIHRGFPTRFSAEKAPVTFPGQGAGWRRRGSGPSTIGSFQATFSGSRDGPTGPERGRGHCRERALCRNASPR